MWTCPTCGTKVDPDFEVCWACGTTPDGVEDPTFVTADDAGPIDDPEPKLEEGGDPNAELPEPLPDLVEGYRPYDTVEAQFLVDQLIAHKIPAALSGTHTSDLNFLTPNFVPRVMVRAQDLTRARTFFEEFEARKRERVRTDDESANPENG